MLPTPRNMLWRLFEEVSFVLEEMLGEMLGETEGATEGATLAPEMEFRFESLGKEKLKLLSVESTLRLRVWLLLLLEYW